MPTTSTFMQKGGSGKTTTTLNLAAALIRLNKKVLVVDADPQANLTQALGITEEPDENLYTELKKEISGEEGNLHRVTIKTKSGLDLVPASLDLAGAELELVSVYGREKILSLLIKPLLESYDFIFIDCPPSISMLTVNALVASDYLLVPMQAEFLHLKGWQSFQQHFARIKKGLNDELDILGLVLTKFSKQKKMHKKVRKILQEEYHDQLFDTRIRTNIALAQAQEEGIDIFKYDKRCHGTEDYEKLAHEFLARIKV